MHAAVIQINIMNFSTYSAIAIDGVFSALILIAQMLIECIQMDFSQWKSGIRCTHILMRKFKRSSFLRFDSSCVCNRTNLCICIVALELDLIQLNCAIAFENEINTKY